MYEIPDHYDNKINGIVQNHIKSMLHGIKATGFNNNL